MALQNRQAKDSAPLDCARGLINGSVISLFLWVMLYLLVRWI
ncbi:hypothetical protein C8P63_105137 [Melghirimyces profundicolus]|uniref:Uncharacterized protein n=1 Tax=Melghirimyces profundicolus TaxID=1242148 RepID=A0A2T6C2I8_9BACL|nr:hypothetical protein [Melghirimyces profundicolus]PTX62542.1 hypothetical protein C8P63_105137 [Melghirimyces profundicolus]